MARAARRLNDHHWRGPSEVPRQSVARIRSPISPPSASHSGWPAELAKTSGPRRTEGNLGRITLQSRAFQAALIGCQQRRGWQRIQEGEERLRVTGGLESLIAEHSDMLRPYVTARVVDGTSRVVRS